MRTIDEIKEKISKNKETALRHDVNDIDGWNEIVEEQDKLRFELLKAITDGIPLDRLDKICNAERDGRLDIRPCKVGDTIYRIVDMENHSAYKNFISMERVEKFGVPYKNIMGHISLLDIADFGKTVFLTKSEAEQALSEMEGK